MPEMFGLIAMLTVFINVGQFLMDGGMTSSLIRMKRPDQVDYSTVFLTNLGFSVVVYIVIFFLAPFISLFYSQEILTNILRLYALTFVIRAFVAVHVAKLTKEMNFKLQMKLQIPSTILGSAVGILMAYYGYGVWSLVWLNIVQTLVFTIQNWIFIKWRPTLIFNKRRFKYHFHFGYKLTLSGLLDTLYNDSYRIVIGKLFSPASVGYFNQAETMRLFPVQQISTVMGKVTYPLFSNIVGDGALRSAYRTTMKLVLFVVVPMMFILILTAKEGFLLLFGEKWLPSVPYFQILCFASIVRPISSYNLNVLKVKGRSDLFLKVEVIKKVIGVVGIIIGIPFGIMGLVLSLTLTSFIFVFVNMFYCGKLIKYSVYSQLRDIGIIVMVGFLVFIAHYYFKSCFISFIEGDLLMVIAISISFFLFYFILTLFLDKMLFQSLKKILDRNSI